MKLKQMNKMHVTSALIDRTRQIICQLPQSDGADSLDDQDFSQTEEMQTPAKGESPPRQQYTRIHRPVLPTSNHDLCSPRSFQRNILAFACRALGFCDHPAFQYVTRKFSDKNHWLVSRSGKYTQAGIYAFSKCPLSENFSHFGHHVNLLQMKVYY